MNNLITHPPGVVTQHLRRGGGGLILTLKKFEAAYSETG